MKLTIIIIISTLVHVSAAGFAQKVSISKKNISLVEAIENIRVQTGYDFVFDSRLIDRDVRLDLNLKNANLKEALTIIFTKQNLDFNITDNLIVIQRHGSSDSKKSADQTIDIRGTVVDEKGDGLPGASVKIKGTAIGTLTDFNGQFTLSGVSTGDILLCTYVGYTSKEIMISPTEGRMIIKLQIASSELEGIEVVSTGYQSLPKERATGSFKVIDRSQIDKPATNIGQRLVGTTAGLVSTMDVQGNPTFRLRGLSTLGEEGAADPLIVLDGFPLENASLNEINPNNVESITVLKDAAAASIWGSRSANGVIVITTKTGKAGVPFSADISAFTRIGRKFDVDYIRGSASSADVIAFEQLAYGKWGAAHNAGGIANIDRPESQGMAVMNEDAAGRITMAQRDAGLARLAGLDNRQQIRDHILDNPISNQVNLNLSGSNARMRNALSALFESSTRDFKGDESKRAMLNYRGDSKINNWLSAEAGLMYQHQRVKENGFTLGDIRRWSPYDMLLEEDGSQVGNFTNGYYMPTLEQFTAQYGSKFPYDFYYNPLRDRDARDFSSEYMNVRAQGGLTATIIKGLSVSSKILYEAANGSARHLSLEDAFSVRNSINNSASWDQTAAGAVTLNLPKGAQLDQESNKMRSYNFRNQIDFNRNFGQDHGINAVVGMEIRERLNQLFISPTTYGYNDQTLAVGVFPNGSGGPFRQLPGWIRGANSTFGYTPSFGYRTDTYYSEFANLSYTFRQKYSLSGSYRTDASNLIAENDKARYSPFWSVGGLWRAGEEQFIKQLSWIDQLAVRLTYGVNGNEDRSTSPRPLLTILPANPNTGAVVSTVSSYGNPLLRWEKSYMLNAGIDFSLFQGKLFGSLEAYDKRGKDLLAVISIPSVNGATTQKYNNVEMYNRGIDVELGTALRITDHIGWRGSVNYSYNANKITRLFRSLYTADDLVQTDSRSYVEGYNASSIWSYDYVGVIDGQPSLAGPNGSSFFLGNFVFDDGRDWMHRGGITIPPHTFGFNTSFNAYRFNLSAIVVGKFGHVYRREGFNYPLQTSYNTMPVPNYALNEVLNGDPSQILTLPEGNTSATYSIWGGQANVLDYLIENANHVRLQEVNLSYDLNKDMLQRYGLAGLQFYAQGNNLLVITNNTYNEDPEYRMGSLNPTPRFTFGFKLRF